jgi:acylphosphatase
MIAFAPIIGNHCASIVRNKQFSHYFKFSCDTLATAQYIMSAAHFTISGRVQGVGFRAYVHQLANELRVHGAVWNTRDGNVEAIAGHTDPARLEEFAAQLALGPGRVTNIARMEIDETSISPGFEIRPTV